MSKMINKKEIGILATDVAFGPSCTVIGYVFDDERAVRYWSNRNSPRPRKRVECRVVEPEQITGEADEHRTSNSGRSTPKYGTI